MGVIMDLSGQRFGCLQVIKQTGERYNSNYYYLCKCDCGCTTRVLDKSLICGETKSCGHIQREVAKRIGTKTIAKNSKRRIAIDKKYNTNINVIGDTDLKFKSNKSGFRGVCWDKSKHKWEAYIYIHNKKIHLGRFEKIEDAVESRKNAEQRYFTPIIELAKQNNDLYKKGDKNNVYKK